MEIDNAIFQDLESCGKGKFFKMAMESFGFFFGKIQKCPKMIQFFYKQTIILLEPQFS